MPSLIKLLHAIIRPRYWPALARGVVPCVEHANAFINQNYDIVVDVGANKGQFAAFAIARWPKARLICFEPLPGPRAKLVNITSGRADIYCFALGEVEGETVMHVASRADSSSLLPLGETQKLLFNMEESSKLNVQVRRLDKIINGGDLPRPALLKIDVQGFEYETLQGSEGLLNAIDAVYVEASFVELYAGQKLAVDVAALLAKHGFNEVGRYNLCTSDDVLVQADILFKRI